MFLLSELVTFLADKNFIDLMPVIEKDLEINRFASLEHPSDDALCWAKKILPSDRIPSAAVLICLPEQPDDKNLQTVMLHVKEPRRVFAEIVSHFYPEEHLSGVSEKAVIHPTVIMGDNVYAGPGTVIGKQCRIGDGTVIDANVTIYHGVTIGKNCHISSGAVLGSDGHGYVLDENRKYRKIRHMGSVVIGNNVDIGANSCVDRGVLDDTVIGDNTKIDNLVQIAHNVKVGQNCIITAGSILAGSSAIGDDCWIAPGAVIKNGVSIAKHVQVGMNSVVYRSSNKEDTVLQGDPASIVMNYKK